MPKSFEDLVKDDFDMYRFSGRTPYSPLVKILDDHKLKGIEVQFNSIFNETTKYFANISSYSSTISESGNSNKIVRKFSGIYGLKTVDAKIRRLLSTLHSLQTEELIYNKDIAEVKRKEKRLDFQSAYNTLKALQEQLRLLIESELSQFSSNWWTQCIPPDVRKNAEERKKLNQKPWPWIMMSDIPVTQFLDFNEYVKIITQKDNWRNTFKKIFVDKELITSKFRELDPIRKTIAHNRDLSRSNKTRLSLYRNDIGDAVSEFEKKTKNEIMPIDSHTQVMMEA